MQHLVKILVNDDGDPIDEPVWHLVVVRDGAERTFCQGEVFGYGESQVEYEDKQVKRGGITCAGCLSLIKKIKAVRLC